MKTNVIGLNKDRNLQIDGLRGIGCIIIVLFHCLCRFSQLYLSKDIMLMNGWGDFGVALFLIITSFTLKADKKEENFSVIKYWLRKIIRLWPMYAVAITLTFAVTRILPLPERTVGIFEYIFNLSMLNGFIGVSYVDGAHWYITTLIAIYFVVGLMKKISVSKYQASYIVWLILCFLLLKLSHGVSIARFVGGRYTGIVCCGVATKAICDLMDSDSIDCADAEKPAIQWVIVLLCSLLFEFLVNGFNCVIHLIICSLLVCLAYQSKLAVLEFSVLQVLSAISYTLYLIHQNIAMIVQWYLMKVTGYYSFWFALVSIVIVIILAVVLHYFVEIPINKNVKQIQLRYY